jgi:hypothetical protein
MTARGDFTVGSGPVPRPDRFGSSTLIDANEAIDIARDCVLAQKLFGRYPRRD